MPPCCHLTRRQFLAWAAVVAATPLLSELDDPARASGSGGGVAVPMNLELVTLTETSIVLTWYTGDPSRPDRVGRPSPVPADTEVLLGTSPMALRPVLQDTALTPYHYAEINRLEPGQTYYYLARSRGIVAAPAPFALGNPVGTSTLAGSVSGPFLFTALQPPRGRHLFTIALCNDLHVGETTAGLIKTVEGIGVPPGFQQVPGEPPYTQVMAEALVADVRARGADLLLAAGVISAEAGLSDLANAKSYLDAFGRYQTDYLVTRGNHDRPHQGRQYATCQVVAGARGYYDCFRDEFFPDGRTWFVAEHFGLRLIGLDTYEKIGNGADNGVLSNGQFAFLRETLASNRDVPTLVFGHHPVTLEASLTTTEPLLFDLNQQQAVQLEQLYAASPGVFLHHSGHPPQQADPIGLRAACRVPGGSVGQGIPRRLPPSPGSQRWVCAQLLQDQKPVGPGMVGTHPPGGFRRLSVLRRRQCGGPQRRLRHRPLRAQGGSSPVGFGHVLLSWRVRAPRSKTLKER